MSDPRVLLNAAIKNAQTTIEQEMKGEREILNPESPRQYRNGLKINDYDVKTGEVEQKGSLSKSFFINKFIGLVEKDKTIKSDWMAKALFQKGKEDYQAHLDSLGGEDDHIKPKPLSGVLKGAIEAIGETYDNTARMRTKASPAAVPSAEGKFKGVPRSGKTRQPSVPGPSDMITHPGEPSNNKPNNRPANSKNPVWIDIDNVEYLDAFADPTNTKGKIAGHGAAPENPALGGSKLKPLPEGFDIFKDQDKKLPIPNIADGPKNSPKR